MDRLLPMPLLPIPRGWATADWRRTGAIVLVGAIITWKGAQLVVLGSSFPVLAVALVLVGWAINRRPDLALVAVLALGATVFPRTLVDLNLGPVRTDVVELSAFCVIAMWVVGRLRNHLPPAGPFSRPLLIIMASVLTGATWSLFQGTTQQALQGSVKTLLLYLLVFPMGAFFPGLAGKVRLERIIIFLACGGALYSVWVAATGFDPVGGGKSVDQSVVLLGGTLDAQRVRFDVLPLVFLAVLLVTGRIALHGFRALSGFQLALFGVVIALSFNRSTWLPLVGTMILMTVLRPGPRSPLRTLRVGLGVGVVLIAVTAAATSGALGPTGRAITERASSTVNPSVVTENSYKERTRETAAALETLSHSPIFGTGLARPYGFRKLVELSNPTRYVYADRPYIHNQFLSVWLQLGLLGLAGFLALAVQVLRMSLRAVRTLPPDVAVRALAGGLALFGAALQAWFQTSLYYRPSILAVVCSLALLNQRPEPAGQEETRVVLTGVVGQREAHRR